MSYTLLMVASLAALVILFSNEWMGFVKKVLAIKGAKTLLPLLLASALVVSFPDFVLFLLYSISFYIKQTFLFLEPIMPEFSWGEKLIIAVFLTLLSVLPVYLLSYLMHRNSYKVYPYPYLTSTVLWIIAFSTLLFVSV